MIDLHLHTNYSDGENTPIEILKKCEEKGIEYISITDHDSIKAYYELENINIKDYYHGTLITGTELKAMYNKNISIEVLGYGIDYHKLKIKYMDREKKQQVILDFFKKVAKEYNLKFDSNMKIDENNTYAGLSFGKELLRHKENDEIIIELCGEKIKDEDFFRKCQSNINSPFYYDETKDVQTIDEIIESIHDACGKAFLAHPYLYDFENADKEIESILKNTNIDGIECFHSRFTEDQSKKLVELCKKYNKYMSGGSDYHGNRKPDIEIGTGTGTLNIDRSILKWINN